MCLCASLMCGWLVPCRFGGLVRKVLATTAATGNGNGRQSPMDSMDDSDELTKQQFNALLEKIDSGLRALPATAQVGRSSYGCSTGRLFKPAVGCQAHLHITSAQTAGRAVAVGYCWPLYLGRFTLVADGARMSRQRGQSATVRNLLYVPWKYSTQSHPGQHHYSGGAGCLSSSAAVKVCTCCAAVALAGC